MLLTSFRNKRKALILLLFMLSGSLTSVGQISAYFNTALFNTPQNKPFLETYFTIVGSSLAAKEKNGQLQNSVTIVFELYKDTTLFKTNRYNLLGPSFTPSATAASFIDQQRYTIPNGTYTLRMSITDNYDATKKPLRVEKQIQVNFSSIQLQASSIQPIESYKKSESTGPLSKSGFELIPYNVNYYPETSKELAFYFETYNSNLALGDNKAFVYSYYLELSDNHNKLNSYGAFKKQMAAAANPLLAKIDISKLGTGNYNLVIEVRDETNTLRLQEKYYFQRLNRNLDIVVLQKSSEKIDESRYFGNCNNIDTLRMFVECLWPIADGLDKDRIINQSLQKNGDQMKRFVVDFWTRRAADTANPLKLWSNYYKNVQTVMALFKCGKQKGYYSDRGRVYLQYGAPSQRSMQPNEPNAYPYEIWQYYRTTDASTGAFFSNRKFVFVNKMLGDECYMLIHSDMRGELNNPRWQFELTRRNNDGLSNPDNNTPTGTENNQFNDIYSNPR